MESLRNDIFELKTVDMHNHLDIDETTQSITVKDFWDLGEYFWLRRHLWSAGYPLKTEDMPFDERVEHWIKAFNNAQNTIWARALKLGVKELYNIEIQGKTSIYEIDEVVKDYAKKNDRSKVVLDKAKIEYFAVNSTGEKDFGVLDERAVSIVAIDYVPWAKRLSSGEDVREEIFNKIDELSKQNIPGIRISTGRLIGYTFRKEILFKNMSYDDSVIAVLHFLCEACQKHNIFIEIFLGVVGGNSNIPAPFNDVEGVLRLYGLFGAYPECRFSLLTASQAQNIDVVNAANVYPNVYADGLWWYNLRPSSYFEVFSQRIEEMPSIKSSIVASDAYTAEWCYIKMNVIKQSLFEFMKNQIERGSIDRELALKVSKDWLSTTAKTLFGKG